MINLTQLNVNAAGAYVSVGGLYPFAIGNRLFQGRLPLARLGGQIDGRETGWQCARRHVLAETRMRIHAVQPPATFLHSGNHRDDRLTPIPWQHPFHRDATPLVVITYNPDGQDFHSLMYLAEASEQPEPSGDTRGILMLDPAAIQQICAGPLTLRQYLDQGGQAILKGNFNFNIAFEPFIQLRIFARILQQINLQPEDEPMAPKDELRKMVIAQKTASLPLEPPAPAFAALHQALVNYDRFVSERVIAAIGAQPVSLDAAALATTQAEVERCLQESSLPAGRDLAIYQKYKDRLDTMAGLLLKIQGEAS